MDYDLDIAEDNLSDADGNTTIFKMLEGKYADEKTREPYEKWPIFPPLLFVGVGMNRSFANEPKTVSGMSFPLRRPTEIGEAVRDRMPIHIFKMCKHDGKKFQTTVA